jgi:ATP-dependent DNA helicase Q1
MVQLLTAHYLTESFHQNSYAVIVYVAPGPQAPRLTRLSREQVENGRTPKIMCSFRNKSKSATLAARKSVGSVLRGPARKKEKGLDDELSRKLDQGEVPNSDGFFVSKGVTQLAKKRTRAAVLVEPDADDSEPDRDWTYSLSTPDTRKRQRRSDTHKELPREQDDPEIVILSD